MQVYALCGGARLTGRVCIQLILSRGETFLSWTGDGHFYTSTWACGSQGVYVFARNSGSGTVRTQAFFSRAPPSGTLRMYTFLHRLLSLVRHALWRMHDHTASTCCFIGKRSESTFCVLLFGCFSCSTRTFIFRKIEFWSNLSDDDVIVT